MRWRTDPECGCIEIDTESDALGIVRAQWRWSEYGEPTGDQLHDVVRAAIDVVTGEPVDLPPTIGLLRVHAQRELPDDELNAAVAQA